MGSLYESNTELLAALCILAPEGNVRVALVGLIDMLEEAGEAIAFTKVEIYENIARGIIRLHIDLDDEDGDEHDHEHHHHHDDQDIIKRFQRELGIEGEEPQ